MLPLSEMPTEDLEHQLADLKAQQNLIEKELKVEICQYYAFQRIVC
jgi:hypothetical protein